MPCICKILRTDENNFKILSFDQLTHTFPKVSDVFSARISIASDMTLLPQWLSMAYSFLCTHWMVNEIAELLAIPSK